MLKSVKKIISGVLTFSMLLSVISFVPAYATEFKDYEITDSLPRDWTYSVTENSSVEIADFSGEKSILLSADRSSSKGTAKAELFSESFNFSGKQVFLYRMAINNSTEDVNYKRVYLNDSENKDELLLIKPGVLKIGQVEYDVDLANGEFFDLLIAVDTQNQKTEVWLNDEKIITTTAELSDYVGKDVKLHFVNNFTNKKMSSLWYISKCERISDAMYAPVSNPSDSSQVTDVERLECIEVNFGTAILNLDTANVTLEECDAGNTNYTEMEVTVKSGLANLYITPVDGFSKPKQYRLTISHGEDIFNEVHDSYIMNFGTAPEGYELPECLIEIERKEYFVGETVNISAEITEGSEAITKAELYVNGELKKVYTDTFDFNITAKAGTNEVYIKLYDALGSFVESNIVNYTVTENQPPVITLNVSDGQVLEPGEVIKVSAEDTDGEIIKVNLRLDGQKTKEEEASTLEWTVPEDITLGKHSLEIYAVDNYGKNTIEKLQVEFDEYTVNNKVIVDYSTFSDNFNSGTKTIGPITACTNSSSNSVRYIKNDNIDENHPNCVVMGSDAYTGGATKTWLGIDLGESTKPKNIAIFETNIYASSTEIITSVSLKDSTAQSCTLIEFLKGDISFKNGDAKTTLQFQAGKWYEVRTEINLSTKTYTLLLNNEIIAENFTLSKPLVDISTIRIEFGNYVSGTGYVATDKFNLYDKVEFLAISEVECLQNGSVVEGEGADAVLTTLRNKVDTTMININDIKFFVEGKELRFKDYNLNENQLIINLLTQLEAGYEYKVEISYTVGEKTYKTAYSFLTPLGENEGITSPEFVIEDSNIKFTANVQCNENKTVRVIIAKFENNIMTEIESCNAELTANTGNFIESPAIYFDDSENITYKIYIWNDWTNRTAIGNKMFELSNRMTDL